MKYYISSDGKDAGQGPVGIDIAVRNKIKKLRAVIENIDDQIYHCLLLEALIEKRRDLLDRVKQVEDKIDQKWEDVEYA